MRRAALTVAFALAACGVKAPPRPPGLDATPTPTATPTGGSAFGAAPADAGGPPASHFEDGGSAPAPPAASPNTSSPSADAGTP